MLKIEKTELLLSENTFTLPSGEASIDCESFSEDSIKCTWNIEITTGQNKNFKKIYHY